MKTAQKLTETELRVKGYQILTDSLGIVDAERFIALVLREPFDYTKWRQNLWPNMSVEEISAAAMASRRAKQKTTNPEKV